MNFRFLSLELTNYRLYKGYTKLNFGTADSQNVTIVLGKNGAGKSTILNALTWCFYGIEAHSEGAKTERSMPIVNTTVLKELADGETATAEVIITLEIDNKISSITRTINAQKIGTQISNTSDNLVVMVNDDNNQTETYFKRDAEKYIETLIPEALRNFFFIDGEQLRTFFEISTPDKIEDAIDRLSKLDVIKAAIRSLNEYTKNLNSQCKTNDPEINRVKNEISQCDQLISSYEEKISDCNKKKKSLEIEEAEINAYLKENNNAAISKWATERDAAKHELQSLEASYKSATSKRNAYLSEMAPFIYMRDTIKGAYNVIEGMVSRGELPEKIREYFIEDLLESGVCICGTKIGEKERATLEAYAKKMRVAGVSDIAVQGRLILKQILDKIESFPDEIDDLNSTVQHYSEQIDDVNEIIKEAAAELQKYDEDTIKRKNSRYNEINRELAKIINEHDRFVAGKETREKLKEKYQSNLQTLLQKDAAQRVLAQKLKLAENTKHYLKEIEEEVKTRIRRNLERNTEKTFLSLERKKDAFQWVKIDSKYNVDVHHKDGYNALDNLSAGEYLLLGLSFMYALRSISGYLMPVIIDTPLGKIDDEHRNNITQQLPKLLFGSQLVLLVTPTEYDPVVRKNLNEFISDGANYVIAENEDKTAASLEVVR